MSTMTNKKKIAAGLQSALSGQSPLSIDLYVEVLADYEDELKASLDKDADDALLCMLADDGDVAMMVIDWDGSIYVIHQTNQCRLDHTNRIGVRCWPRSGRSIHLDRVMVVMVVTVVLYYFVRGRDGRAHHHPRSVSSEVRAMRRLLASSQASTSALR
jgi:hypothetical protein